MKFTRNFKLDRNRINKKGARKKHAQPKRHRNMNKKM